MKEIIIIGASNNPEKFGNKAIKAYKKEGYDVFPINPKENKIENLKCYHSLNDLPKKIELASIYLPPHIGINILTVAYEMVAVIISGNNNEPMIACSIVAIGHSPSEYN